MMLKSVCEIHVCAKFSSFIFLWSRALFGKWHHTWLAKGNAYRANKVFGYGAATRQHENYLGVVPCLWRTMHGFGTELIRNLAVWLAESQDYDLFIYKVYWYNLSMFVPIFTSFGIKKNSSGHSGRPGKLLAVIPSCRLFFYFMTPCFNTGLRW